MRIVILLFVALAATPSYCQSIPSWLLPFWGGGSGTSSSTGDGTSGSTAGDGGLGAILSGGASGGIPSSIDVNVNFPYTPQQFDEAVAALNELSATLADSNQMLQQYLPVLQDLNAQLATANGNWAQTNALLQDYLNTFNKFVEPANLFKSGFALGAGLAAGSAAVQLVVQLLEQGVQLLYHAISGDLKRKQDQELYDQFVKIKEFYDQTSLRSKKTVKLLSSLQKFYKKVGVANYSNSDFLFIVRLQARFVSYQLEKNKAEEKKLMDQGANYQQISALVKVNIEMEDYLESLQNIEVALKTISNTSINCETLSALQDDLAILNRDLNQSRTMMISISTSVVSFLTEQYKQHQQRMADLSSGDYTRRQKAQLQKTMDEVIWRSKSNIQKNKDLFVQKCMDTVDMAILTEWGMCRDIFEQWFSLYKNNGKYLKGQITNDNDVVGLIKNSVPKINRSYCVVALFDHKCVNDDLIFQLASMSISDVVVGFIRNSYLTERDMVFSKIALYQAMELLDRGDSELVRQQYQAKSLEFAESLKSLQRFIEDLKAELRAPIAHDLAC